MPVSFDAVLSADLLRLADEVASARDTQFSFTDGIEVADADALRNHVVRVARLARDADRLGAELHIAITGHTDAIGTTNFNTQLAGQRADIAENLMLEQGISPSRISRSLDVDTDTANAPNPDLRRVSIVLDLRNPAQARPPASE